MVRRTMVDPPSGWRYGFPRILEEGVTLREFLSRYGYPEHDMELAEKHSRYWEQEVGDRS